MVFCKRSGSLLRNVVPAMRNRGGRSRSEVFARELAVLLDVPVCANAVQRIRDTVPQKELNQKERKNNLKNAFHISKNIVKYSRILLIDDIYTTGSTADELAAEFHKHGINHIYFMSICIGAGH